jgi:hypothetical protein
MNVQATGLILRLSNHKEEVVWDDRLDEGIEWLEGMTVAARQIEHQISAIKPLFTTEIFETIEFGKLAR